MRSRHVSWRFGCAALSAGLAFAGPPAGAAEQDYATEVTLPLPPFPVPDFLERHFAFPVPVVLAAAADVPAGGGGAVAPPASGPAASATGGEAPATPTRTPLDSPFAGLDLLAEQAANLSAPAWVFSPTIGAAFIATDNVNQTKTNKNADLIAQLTPGLTIGAQTPRLQGSLVYTAFIQRALNEPRRNSISHFGNANANLTLVPDNFFLGFGGSAQQLLRDGFQVTNPGLLDETQTTQNYTASVTPTFRSRIGTIGNVDLSYSYSRAWFQNNTGALPTPVGTLGPLSDSTQERARWSFSMPGTLDSRLFTDATMLASTVSSGGGIGNLRRAGGALSNEFQMTRSLSAIGAAGYESIENKNFPQITGDGPTWNVGGRWRPNDESSVLLLYGRHDLANDVAAEVRWQLTPLSQLYVSYSNSIGNPQQSLMGNARDSFFGVDGPLTDLTSENNPVIDRLPVTGGLGASLLDSNSSRLYQNDIVRMKMLDARLSVRIFDNSFSMSAYHHEHISLTGLTGIGDLTVDGTRLTWSRNLTEGIVARTELGYQLGNLNHSEMYNFAMSLDYDFSQTLGAGLRYDYFKRDASTVGGGSVVNSLALRIRKSF